MAESDHIRAIKDYLKSLLKEVKEFKDKYPNLPWSYASPENEEDDG